MKNSLKINQLIEIVASGDYQGTFASRIEEITLEHLNLAAPLRAGELVPLRMGEIICVNYADRNTAYSFVTRIISRQREPIPILTVEYPRSISRVQRRSFARLEVSLPISFQPLEADLEDISEGRTVDLSGGGMMIMTRVDWLKAGQVVRARINLPGREPVICATRVIRVNPIRIDGALYYQAACQFQELREGQRDTIISYIFERERELLKKGLLKEGNRP